MRHVCFNLIRVIKAFTLCLVFTAPAWAAGLTVQTSRVVFDAGKREQTLQLANGNAYPLLIQAWIDNGAPEGTPEAAQAPVMPLPGLFRLAGGARQSLRLIATDLPQRQDQESLYWLNLHAIAPQGEAPVQAAATLAVAVRLQIKVFWRPSGLTPRRPDLPGALRVSWQGRQLRLDNPTPWYAVISEMVTEPEGQKLPVGVLPPYSQRLLPGVDTMPASVRISVLDDAGLPVWAEHAVAAGPQPVKR